MIIIEDDLLVSKDIFSYFNQFLPVLKEDPSVWCLSAWNDQGFVHTTGSESLAYRVEGVPGLGWMMTHRYFKSELEDIWPEISDKVAWNDWLREQNSKTRKECIIPDIPRTYHFSSSKNKALPASYQDDYFNRKDFLQSLEDYPVEFDNVEQMFSDQYEDMMYKLVSSSLLVDHNISPCSADFMKNADSRQTYIAYFRMQHDTSTDVYWS